MRRLLVIVCLFLSLIAPIASISAASSFADPAFEQQWKAGEAITPNFWGPPHYGSTTEDYAQASGGKRLVQYFDKGRMELTNGAVTNGLLATELLKGRIQVADNLFRAKKTPPIPIAGDISVSNITYAAISTKGASLLLPATSAIGQPIGVTAAASGDVSLMPTADGSAQNIIAVFDEATRHNVPKAFADYRTKAGLPTIGLAISEPFHSTIRVADTLRDVVVQIFERRVLTYTANNPDLFKVEMGNVGYQYEQWRFGFDGYAATPPELRPQFPSTKETPLGPPLPESAFGTSSTTPEATAAAQSSASVAPAPPPTTPTQPSPTAQPPTQGALAVSFANVSSPIGAGNVATATIKTAPGASCSITVTYKSGRSKAQGLDPKTVDANGTVSWSWLVGGNTTPGSWPIDVSCSANGQTATQRMNFTVT